MLHPFGFHYFGVATPAIPSCFLSLRTTGFVLATGAFQSKEANVLFENSKYNKSAASLRTCEHTSVSVFHVEKEDRPLAIDGATVA
jgi:hypothetical protein